MTWSRAAPRRLTAPTLSRADPDAYDAANLRGDAPLHIDEVPLQDWARALTDFRHALAIASEPYTRCKPTGGPRQIMSPYGFEIVRWAPGLELFEYVCQENNLSPASMIGVGRESRIIP